MLLSRALVEKLASAAAEARTRAHCPYSNYAVGAAVLTDSGRIFPGCNVESVSYGLSICAERAAICRAVAESGGALRLKAVCVAGDAARPCGACRQVLFEFSRRDTALYLLDAPRSGRRRSLTRTTVFKLLPAAFLPPVLSRRKSP